MKRKWMFAVSLVVTVAFAALPAVEAHATVGPGVLMGQPQKEHWGSGSVECSKGWNPACVDEISAGQFVAWPFIAEHTGTVEALFAVSDTGYNTGVEVGIYANRKYSYPEITFNAEWNSSGQKWTPANFMQYEAEIPPEDPGALLEYLRQSGGESDRQQGWTEFKLGAPVKVIKGEKYWLANTTFAAAGATHVLPALLPRTRERQQGSAVGKLLQRTHELGDGRPSAEGTAVAGNRQKSTVRSATRKAGCRRNHGRLPW